MIAFLPIVFLQLFNIFFLRCIIYYYNRLWIVYDFNFFDSFFNHVLWILTVNYRRFLYRGYFVQEFILTLEFQDSCFSNAIVNKFFNDHWWSCTEGNNLFISQAPNTDNTFFFHTIRWLLYDNIVFINDNYFILGPILIILLYSYHRNMMVYLCKL